MYKSLIPKCFIVNAPLNPRLSLFLFSSSYSSPTSLLPSDLTAAILYSRTADQALQLFTSIVNRNSKSPVKNLPHYSAVIHVLTGAGAYTPARCLIKGLIQSFLKSHDPKRASSLIFDALSRLESSKFTSDVFGTLIIALCEAGLVDEALRVRRKIGVLPARQACNALMNGLVKKGGFDSMWAIYEEMVSDGLVPSVVSYGVLINACCCQGDLIKAASLISEIMEKGIQPHRCDLHNSHSWVLL